MRRSIFSTLLVVLFACTNSTDEHAGHTMSATAPPSTPTAGPAVSLANGGSGYLAVPPKGKANGAGVIVIQEWWGLNDWVREQADRFAAQGYVALAVDLYRGRTAGSPEEAHELMRGLPEDRAISDLKSGFEYLAARPDVDPKRIGAIGWCMGGGYALALAGAEPRLAASVINYGRLITDENAIKAIRPALLGNFGATDRGIPADDVRRFADALRAAGIDGDFKIYEGAGHGFMNRNNKEGFNPEATADAWSRIDAFFTRKLGRLSS